ncbi:MAG: mechanosensitive ion channel [Ignavibacteriales bacterium]|nr:mechanosensitive ion channel [Ignavibacteriales bacterium]MCF8306136.1 mechanosensitive ion channel [Ignavibacteriales bacterium]MCF8315810.1 mechanosensitive ion channel [Ignavibacteriales bacterium]MCF8437270.1 mechanosensitive ion channel [Ignavibacteriales bacterium]
MKEFLETNLFEIGNYTLKIYNTLSFAIFVSIIILLLFIIKKIIYSSRSLDSASKFSINKLTKYIIIIFSFVTSLHLLGFNISVLLAGSAAILVGMGFGLQNLFSDFISGIVLLLDKTLKVDDIIEVNSMIYKVKEINFRSTKVLGRDENYIILPNSELTSNRVINWTHSEISSRFKVTVGVDYSTDIIILIKTLKEVAQIHPKVLKQPEPFVRFEDFGDSALVFSVFFYTDEVFRVENIKSEIRVEIFKALHNHKITIPFPQRVLHIKNE